MNKGNLNFFNRRTVVLILVILFVVVLYYIYYNFFFFHIIKSSPNNNLMPTSYSSMIFEFNKPLESLEYQKKLKIYIDPEINEWNYTIDEKKLTINFHSNFGEGENFNLYINNILSSEGEFYSFKNKYTAQYVELKNLPEEDVVRLTKQSDSFENRFPLIKILPVENETYTIDYIYPDSESANKLPIIISSNFNITTNNTNGIPDDNDKKDYLESLKLSRTEAIDFLKSSGYTTNKYILYFNEPYLTKEFGGSYLEDR